MVIPAHKQRAHGIPFLVHFTAGAISGMVSAIITTPIDVIKTRMQTNVKLDTNNTSHTSKTAGEIFRTIIKEEGWSGLTRGMLPRTVKVAPACAIMISSYELIKSFRA